MTWWLVFSRASNLRDQGGDFTVFYDLTLKITSHLFHCILLVTFFQSVPITAKENKLERNKIWGKDSNFDNFFYTFFLSHSKIFGKLQNLKLKEYLPIRLVTQGNCSNNLKFSVASYNKTFFFTQSIAIQVSKSCFVTLSFIAFSVQQIEKGRHICLWEFLRGRTESGVCYLYQILLAIIQSHGHL